MFFSHFLKLLKKYTATSLIIRGNKLLSFFIGAFHLLLERRLPSMNRYKSRPTACPVDDFYKKPRQPFPSLNVFTFHLSCPSMSTPSRQEDLHLVSIAMYDQSKNQLLYNSLKWSLT